MRQVEYFYQENVPVCIFLNPHINVAAFFSCLCQFIETIASVPTESMVMVETLPTSISISSPVNDALTSDPHTIKVKMTSGKNTTGNDTDEKQKATTLVNSPLNDGQTLTERTQEMEKVQMKEDTSISLPSDEPGKVSLI